MFEGMVKAAVSLLSAGCTGNVQGHYPNLLPAQLCHSIGLCPGNSEVRYTASANQKGLNQ